MPAYAFCPHCGLRFQSRAFQITNSYGTMGGNTETCPQCGHRARIMEGAFSFDGDGQVTVIDGPAWTRELVQEMQVRMRDIERIAQSKRLTDDEARERIEGILDGVAKLNPVVAAEYRFRIKDKPRPAWKKAAIAVAAALAGIESLNTVSDFSERVAGILRYFGWAS